MSLDKGREAVKTYIEDYPFKRAYGREMTAGKLEGSGTWKE